MKSILQPLFDVLPLERAMPELLPRERVNDPVILQAAERLMREFENPALHATIFLYLDDLDATHEISQRFATPLGSFLHGVMHRREGDFSNAKYWFRMAGQTPFQLEGYDPIRFVDQVAASPNSSTLVEIQRQEWLSLARVAT